MVKPIIGDIAANDLADIWSYVARDDSDAADRLIDSFFDSLIGLLATPVLASVAKT